MKFVSLSLSCYIRTAIYIERHNGWTCLCYWVFDASLGLIKVPLLQTCLSKGGGFHCPPCHILDICGFRILFDFPLDLSALTAFYPLPTSFNSSMDEETPRCPGLDVRERGNIGDPLSADDLIFAEPYYKTVKNLHVWNTAFIDVVLISSPMGMLGLPFLTRMKGFSAKVSSVSLLLFL